MGTGLAAMMARRIASMLPPVDRSMTVSEPRSTAILSLASSFSMSEVTAELPMLALILHLAFDADGHRLQPLLEVLAIGGDHHAAPGDLGADQLGVEALAAGDVRHLGGDVPVAGLLDLGHGANNLREADDMATGRGALARSERRRAGRPSGKPHPSRPAR